MRMHGDSSPRFGPARTRTTARKTREPRPVKLSFDCVALFSGGQRNPAIEDNPDHKYCRRAQAVSRPRDRFFGLHSFQFPTHFFVMGGPIARRTGMADNRQIPPHITVRRAINAKAQRKSRLELYKNLTVEIRLEIGCGISILRALFRSSIILELSHDQLRNSEASRRPPHRRPLPAAPQF